MSIFNLIKLAHIELFFVSIKSSLTLMLCPVHLNHNIIGNFSTVLYPPHNRYYSVTLGLSFYRIDIYLCKIENESSVVPCQDLP